MNWVRRLQMSSRVPSGLPQRACGSLRGPRPPPRATSGSREVSQTAQAEEPVASSSGQDHSLLPFAQLVADKRFFCTMCGKCCTGQGEVWVSQDEAERIAVHLGLAWKTFEVRYLKEYSKYEGWRLVKSKGSEDACTFLVDKKCSIHEVRPAQCRTYPWWPDLQDAADWKWEKDNICEGFDHADAPALEGAALEDAARQLREATAREQQRLLAFKTRKARAWPWSVQSK